MLHRKPHLLVLLLAPGQIPTSAGRGRKVNGSSQITRIGVAEERWVTATQNPFRCVQAFTNKEPVSLSLSGGCHEAWGLPHHFTGYPQKTTRNCPFRGLVPLDSGLDGAG